jgi:two-component system sensor histidine kinase DegS
MERVEATLKKAIIEGRRLIREIQPIVLNDEGVIEAIQHLVADLQEHGNLVVTFDRDVQFDRLSPRLEGVIFRIVQESLNNVDKHSQTDRALVKLTQRGDVLDIVVQDLGVGFDPDKVPRDRFGVRGIRERARLLGGMANIESAPSKGTVVSVHLPIDTSISSA